MIRHIFIKNFLAAIVLLSLVSFIGCEKKSEQKDGEVKSESISSNTNSSQSEPDVKEPIEDTIIIPDLKGTWTGTFDKRPTTLKITEQTDSSFSGKITINYREVINQEVKGSFSPGNLKMTMTDQLHSRFEGTYNGNLTQDLENFSGTFTMKVDGSKFTFNLKKK